MLHRGVAGTRYGALSFDALWLARSGLAVVPIVVLTLLARSAPATWVRWAAAGANGAGLALAVAFGPLTRWRELQGPVLVVLFLARGIGAILPR